MSRGESSIDAVAAAARDESLDFAGMSSPDGAVTLLIAEASQEQPATMKEIVERHDGQLVKSEAGASMCSFASAHAGLRSAIELQRAFSSAPLRIGLHSGFVMADASDFYGRNVVLAARIADHAQPGEILVSAALRDYTYTDPTFDFEARGEQHFKGLLGEHPVFAVTWS
jgi:class 3 adenylate cyclase